MKKESILTILNVPKIGPKTARFILDNTSSGWDISSLKEIQDLLNSLQVENKRIPTVTIEELEKARIIADKIISDSISAEIDVISYFDYEYPERYRLMEDAPYILYSKGNIEVLNKKNSVAIIGTRDPTPYGIKAGERLAELFSESGFSIVSGLAIGCDAAAHRGCLKANGSTVAVMAGGLDKIYPKANSALAEEILAKKGCLISEYSIGHSPRAGNFVERDRLQSGLSQAVIVVETDIKGGTMHTVSFSKKQERYLACLSNHPEKLQDHPKIQGNKKIISEGGVPLGNSDEINMFIRFLKDEKNEHPGMWVNTFFKKEHYTGINKDRVYSNFINKELAKLNESKPEDQVQFKLNF